MQFSLKSSQCTVTSFISRLSADEIRLRLGDYDIYSNNELQLHVDRMVKTVFIHPKWNDKTMENDIALLKLSLPVHFSPTVIPICISDDSNDLAGQNATVTGWGKQISSMSFFLKKSF